MEKAQIKKALEELRKNAVKRKFKQSVDFALSLKDIDLKKTDGHIDIFVTLPHQTGKQVKVCGLTGGELTPQAKKECNFTISNEEFKNYAGNKKAIKKLADQYDYFVAQANIMPEVAKTFGSILGPKKKMPNPKAGCVVPPNANLKLLVEKLQKTVRLTMKTELAIKAKAGNEELSDDDLTDNILFLYNSAVQNLPSERNNVKKATIKFTMGKPVKLQ